MNGYGTADLHIHSNSSDGMMDISEILEYVEHETDLDVIAITDHNTFHSSYRARELARKGGYRFEVVVGMEVATDEGHLLALFLEEPVPYFQPLADTIAAVHAQGGLCIVPHPMGRQSESIPRQTLELLLELGNDYPDGIEIIDSPTLSEMFVDPSLKMAKEFSKRHHLAEIGNSDAHSLTVIGTRYTVFEERTSADLKRSIWHQRTKSRDRKSAEVCP